MNAWMQGMLESLAGVFGAEGFLRPWALLLSLLPLLALALERLPRGFPGVRSGPADYADPALRPWSERTRVPHWQPALRRGLSVLAWALLCLALAGPWRPASPTAGMDETASGHQGQHLILLIPRCGGADAVLLSALHAAISALDGADASLIVYAGNAALLLPATHDPALLRGALQQLDTPRLSGLDCDPRAAQWIAERERARWRALGGAAAQAVLTIAGVDTEIHTGIDTGAAAGNPAEAIAPAALPGAVRRTLLALPRVTLPGRLGLTTSGIPLLLGLLLGAFALSPWPRRPVAPPVIVLCAVLCAGLPGRRLQAAEPAEAWAQNWQAGLQTLAADDPLLALPALQRAWLLAPPGRLQWQALYNLGLAHARLGDWQAAFDAWSRVALALPGDAATQRNLHVARRALAQQRLREADELRGRRGLGAAGEIQTDFAGDANLKAFLDDTQSTREGATRSGAGTGAVASPAARMQPATAYRAPDGATLSSALRKQQMLEDRPLRLYEALQRSDRQHAADASGAGR